MTTKQMEKIKNKILENKNSNNFIAGWTIPGIKNGNMCREFPGMIPMFWHKQVAEIEKKKINNKYPVRKAVIIIF